MDGAGGVTLRSCYQWQLKANAIGHRSGAVRRLAYVVLTFGIAVRLISEPQSALAQSCSTSGVDPVAATCSNPGGTIVTNNTTNLVSPNAVTNDRIQSFNADLIGSVTNTTTVNGAGLSLITTKVNGGITMTNNGAVTTNQALNALQLNGNGGLITYSGNGSMSTNSGIALAITNNGGGNINANTGTGTIVGSSAISLSTTGSGTIGMTTGGAITGTISTTAVDGLNTVNVTGGTIQAAGFAIEASSTGTGGVTVNTTGGQVNGGLTGIVAVSSGTAGDLHVTAGSINSALESGVFASISNAQSAGAVRVDVNGTISANEDGVSAGGFGAVTVNVGSNITAGGRGVDAANENGLVTVNQTAGTIHSNADGIDAGAVGTGGVSVNMSGGQIGSSGNAVGGAGIFTQSLGTSGDINVTARSIFSLGDGIYARIGNAGSAGNISVTVSTGATVNVSSATGIFAETVGSGDITINVKGNVSTSNGHGIDAEITRDPFDPLSGTGSVSIVNNANIVSGGAFAGVNIVGGSANSITNTASITGNVGLRIAGGTTSLTNLGTITGAGGTALQIDSGTLQLGNGNGTIVGNIIDNGVFAINRTEAWIFAGGISGTGEFQQLGTNTTTLAGANSYTGPTTINAGMLQAGAVNAFSPFSAFSVASGAGLDLNGFSQVIGSLAGDGNVTLGPATLITGNDGTSTIFSGGISGAGGLTKIGVGTFALSGVNSYAGATVINGGTLEVDGTLTGTSSVMVNTGGMLTGTGTIDPLAVIINNGATFAPGNGAPGTSMAIVGNLAFQSGAIYLIQLNPATSSFANVTGTATPGGAAVEAFWANGSYISKKYTILTATGGVSGTFGSLANTNLPANFSTSLSYDANHAFLDLMLNFTPRPGPNFGSGLNVNQQNIANALVNFFNSTGSIPLIFGTLSPTGLTQASGETATGSQQTTFDAMNQFLGLLLDPFIDGRGNPVAPPIGAASYAGEDAFADAGSGKKRKASERDTYGLLTKAPLRNVYDPHWSVWAASFGGSQSTDGSRTLGSNNTTSRIFGVAAGADYLLSPRTIVGFALAGGGTGFSVANGGAGRSDLFQAGGFVRHTVGQAYISGALAYGWQDITTDRTVTVAGVDRLGAEFNANAFSGRVEGGYRFVTPWLGGVGITPYAAAQFTTFDLPAYAEQVLSGATTFALAYGAQSITDSRSEVGIRTDKSYAMQSAILTLRSRFAWSHDFNPDRNIGATFQALPGASFVVNGAAQAHDSELTTASAEMKWMNGWSAAATFESEFSAVTRSYAGKGVVRYSW